MAVKTYSMDRKGIRFEWDSEDNCGLLGITYTSHGRKEEVSFVFADANELAGRKLTINCDIVDGKPKSNYDRRGLLRRLGKSMDVVADELKRKGMYLVYDRVLRVLS